MKMQASILSGHALSQYQTGYQPSNRMPSRLSNNNDSFNLTSLKKSKLKFINSSNVASFERSSTQTGLLTLCMYLRIMVRSGSALTSVISIQPTLKMKFYCLSLILWSTTPLASKGCLLWIAFQGIIKSRCTWKMKSIHHSEHCWVSFAIWLCRLA